MSMSHRARSTRLPSTALALLLQAAALQATAAGLTHSGEDIVNTGGHLYQAKCAVCHGASGKGDGPYANLLTARPSDLTLISRRNDGEFPLWKIYETISANEMVPAHGVRDMPIWGQELADEAATLGMNEKSYIRGRIFSMIAYLLSIQQP
jgi:mono/diheme cytochrome c family protein